MNAKNAEKSTSVNTAPCANTSWKDDDDDDDDDVEAADEEEEEEEDVALASFSSLLFFVFFVFFSVNFSLYSRETRSFFLKLSLASFSSRMFVAKRVVVGVGVVVVGRRGSLSPCAIFFCVLALSLSLLLRDVLMRARAGVCVCVCVFGVRAQRVRVGACVSACDEERARASFLKMVLGKRASRFRGQKVVLKP